MKYPHLMPNRSGSTLLAGVATLSLFSTLVGCAVGGSSLGHAVTSTPAVSGLQGQVHGGNQPVSGSKVQLYVAGAPATGSGYGLGATPLGPVATTDANGNFTITGTYTCPTPAAQAYIVATGGNPGLGGPVNNANLAMMAALGTCPAGGNLLATIPFMNINEVTTVAAVWALQQFMAAPAPATVGAPNIGAPTTSYATGTSAGSVQSGVIGMNNAFTTAKVLADVATGMSPNTNYAYATPESAKINTIADVLAYCINSSGSTGECASLMGSATPAGKTAPADTIQAAWYMAQNPTLNTATLYSYVTASAPFVGLATAPADWTVGLNYAPTYAAGIYALNESYGIALDAYGNPWVVNAGGITTAVSAPAGVVELGTDGSAATAPANSFTASTTGGAYSQFTTPPTTNTRIFTAPTYIAVDLANNAWAPNTGDIVATGTPAATPIAEFTGSSAPLTNGTGLTVPLPGGFWVNYTAQGVAIDGSNNVYTATSAASSINQASLMDQRSVAKMLADGTGYTYSTSTSTGAPSATPGGVTLLAIDTNTAVTGGPGGILWGLDMGSCKTQGQGINATTTWGLINTYNSNTITAPLAGSQIATTISGVSIGTASTCGSSSVKPAQAISAYMSTPAGIAIDRNNGAWLTNQESGTAPNLSGFDGLTYLAPSTVAAGTIPNSYNLVDGALGTTSTPSVPGTTLNRSTAIAVDGNNNAWIASSSLHTVAEAAINTANATPITLLTPAGVGFTHAVAGSSGLAIDPSGNVWVTNKNATSNYTNQAGVTTADGNSVTVIVGAAGPVVTPLALAIKSNKLGQKP